MTGRPVKILAAILFSLVVLLHNNCTAFAYSLLFPNSDFEMGNLSNWTAAGEAFLFQPTHGDNPTARHRGQPSQHQGRYWIGTYERYQGRFGETPGAVQGDGPQGDLTSIDFTIRGKRIAFLVGGGSHPGTAVNLVVSGRIVKSASGENTESMRQVVWDVDEYLGGTAFIQIIDRVSGGWGHINADAFHYLGADISPPGGTLGSRVDLNGVWRCNDGGTYYLRQVGKTLWWFGQSGDSGRTWSNVFRGEIQGVTIRGEWADVPMGYIRNCGEMTLGLEADGSLSRIDATGGFGGSRWSR